MSAIKAYIGSIIIHAEPMEKNGEPGYRVVYPDNYESWSPKHVFDQAYRPVSDMEARLVVQTMSLDADHVISDC
jgi:hypothetical protein